MNNKYIRVIKALLSTAGIFAIAFLGSWMVNQGVWGSIIVLIIMFIIIFFRNVLCV